MPHYCFTVAGACAVVLMLAGCATSGDMGDDMDNMAKTMPAEDAGKEMMADAMSSQDMTKEQMPGQEMMKDGMAASGNLTDTLVSQLGVSTAQAMGGAGAIFSLAKSSLSAAEFGQVAAAVPGMDGLLDAAPTTTAGSLGSVAGIAGGGDSLGTLASLAGPFNSLGMDADMIGKFVPIILDYVQGSGGSSTMGILQKVLL